MWGAGRSLGTRLSHAQQLAPPTIPAARPHTFTQTFTKGVPFRQVSQATKYVHGERMRGEVYLHTRRCVRAWCSKEGVWERQLAIFWHQRIAGASWSNLPNHRKQRKKQQRSRPVLQTRHFCSSSPPPSRPAAESVLTLIVVPCARRVWERDENFLRAAGVLLSKNLRQTVKNLVWGRDYLRRTRS